MRNRQRTFGILIVIVAGLVSSCIVVPVSSDDSGDDSQSGTVATYSQGGSVALTTAAAPVSGLGGASSSGGSGGDTSSSTGFDATVTAGCATWPANKLLPEVGPFFYGSTNGPCQATIVMTSSPSTAITTTYAYDTAGKVTSATQADSASSRTFTYQYEGDNLVSILLDGAAYMTLTYTVSSVVGDQNGVTYTWQLDTLGYPRQLLINTSYTSKTHQYQYQDCRVLSRVELTAGSDGSSDLSYVYDAQGHLSVMNTSIGTTMTYDYSCWD